MDTYEKHILHIFTSQKQRQQQKKHQHNKQEKVEGVL